MPIRFACPYCGAKTLADDRFAGRSGPCRACGEQVAIPLTDSVLMTELAQKASANAVFAGLVGGGILFGSAGVLLQLLPATYLALAMASLGVQGWTVFVAPLVMTAALVLVGGFIGSTYYGLIGGVLQRNPQALQASVMGGLIGFLSGAAVGFAIATVPVVIAGGGMGVWFASASRTLLITLGCASAAAFMTSLVCGVAYLPSADQGHSPTTPARQQSLRRAPPPGPPNKNQSELIRRVARRTPTMTASIPEQAPGSRDDG